MAGSAIAIGALLAGGGILFAVYILVRRLHASIGFPREPFPVAHAAIESVAAGDAGVLVVQQGGRILFANEQARTLFALNGERPDLNRMAVLAEPKTAFYELLIAPGQNRLTIGSHPVEAQSFSVQDSEPPQFIVVLRDPQPFAEIASGQNKTHTGLAIVADLNQIVAASRDVSETITAVLGLLRRSFEFQLGELWLWDAEQERLQRGNRIGDPEYLRVVEQMGTDYAPESGVPGWIVRTRRPLLIADSDHESEPKTLMPEETPLRSLLGVPLLHEERLLGTIFIGARALEAYTAADSLAFETIASTAGAAIHTAQAYTQERSRVTELLGLIQVAQTSALVSEARELNATLTARIADLMQVAICAILLHDEEQALLLPQAPAHGVPELFIDSLRIPVAPGSAADLLWRENEYWFTNRFKSDPAVRELGLDHMATAFGIESTLLVPLLIGGRRIGAIITANKNGGKPFTEIDARRLASIAGQAAALIDNARLVREAEARARLAEGASQITDLSASNLAIDELIEQVITKTTALFDADYGLVFLLDEARGELGVHPLAVIDRTEGGGITLQSLERADATRLDTAHPDFKYTVTATAFPLFSMRAREDQPLNRLYRPTQTQLQAESLMFAPLVVGGRGLGEIWIATQRPYGLNKSDMPMLVTTGAHLASSIERQRLGAVTDASLRSRVDQLSSLSRMSRELNRTLDQEQILQAVYDEALRSSGADGGSLVLLDLESEEPHALHRIGKGFSQVELSDLERKVLQAGESSAIGASTHIGTGLLHESRSGLIVPIAYQNQVVGLINLHSMRRNAFDDEQLGFIEALAGHAAIAVGNARRYQDQMQRGELLRRRADQFSQLLHISRDIRSDHPLDQTLESIASGIQDAVGFNVVSIAALEPADEQLHTLAAAGLPLTTFEERKANPLGWNQISARLQDELRISQSYFLPSNQQPKPNEEQLSQKVASNVENNWHAGDELLVPLLGSGGQTIGLLTIADPRNHKIPDKGTIETIEVFANQAALAIENARLFTAEEQRAAELAASLDKVQASYHELDEASRSLQQKDTRLSQLVSQLDLRNKRLLALHHISAVETGAIRPDELPQTVADSLRKEMEIDLALLASVASDENAVPKILGISGELSDEVDMEVVLAAENVLQQVLREHNPLFIRWRSGSRWAEDPLLNALQLRSFVAVPLQLNTANDGVLLVGSRGSQTAFSAEDIDLFQILAQQIDISLENMRLLSETRELQSFTDAVFQSIQQGIVVLNAQGEILSSNDYMRRRYGWDQAGIGQQIFTFRPVLRVLGLEDQLQSVIDSGEPIAGFNIRYPIGEAEPIQTSVSAYTLQRAEKISGVVLLLEDVSERKRLEADVRARAAQLEALTEVSRAISSVLRVEDVVTLVLDQVGSVIPYDSATLWLREGDFLRVAAATGFEDEEDRLGLIVEPEDSALYTEMQESHQPIVVSDVHADARFPGSDLLEMRSWLGVPLLSKGQVLGLLALDKVEVDFHHKGQVDLARGFANQAAVALDNARLFEESVAHALQLNERTQRLQILSSLAAELGTTLDRAHAMNVSIEHVARAIDVEQAAIIIFDEKRESARLISEYPTQTHPPVAVTFTLQNNAFVEHLRKSGAALSVEDVSRESLLDPMRLILKQRQVKSVLIAPLNARGHVIGFIQLESRERQRRFTPGEIELTQTIANQSAIALQNAQLFEEAQQRLIELETINFISRAITATMDQKQLMNILREQITALLETENVYIALYDPLSDEVTFPLYYHDGVSIEIERQPVAGLTEKIIRSGEALRLSEELDVGIDNLPDAGNKNKRKARSYLGLPLLTGENVTGVVTVINYERYDAFTRTHERILTTLAAQVTVAIENARLFSEVRAAAAELEQRIAERTRDVQQERDRVETLLRITSELSASLDLDSVLTRALSLVNDAIRASHGALYLLDPLSDGLICRAALGSAEPLPAGGTPAPFGKNEGLVGWVLANNSTVISNNLEEEDRWIEPATSANHNAAEAAPVVSGQDLLGTLVFFSDGQNAFTEEQLQLVTAAANQVASAVNNAELYRLIRDQAERLGGMLRNQQVEASKSRAILEAVADGVMVSDDKGAIILLNRSAEMILKLERDEVAERPVSELIGIYGAAGQSWLAAIERWRVEPDSIQPGDFLAERIELDDQRIPSVHIAPVIRNDEYIGSVSLFRDITREVEVDRLKTEFVTTVSHELRTPMTSIKGYADLLLLGAAGPLEEQQRQFMETIRSNANRLKLLVEDLLVISKIESGKIELNLTMVDIYALLQDVRGHLEGEISSGEKTIHVVDEVPHNLPPVHGDDGRLMQIFRNLADNAYNYTPDGGTVTFRARKHEGALQIEVQDTGIGLEPEEKARVFERFYRGEDPLVLASAGTGLGLNIVQRLVEMHAGQIWVDSEGSGTGSTFNVLLPVDEPDPPAESNVSPKS